MLNLIVRVVPKRRTETVMATNYVWKWVWVMNIKNILPWVFVIIAAVPVGCFSAITASHPLFFKADWKLIQRKNRIHRIPFFVYGMTLIFRYIGSKILWFWKEIFFIVIDNKILSMIVFFDLITNIFSIKNNMDPFYSFLCFQFMNIFYSNYNTN